MQHRRRADAWPASTLALPLVAAVGQHEGELQCLRNLQPAAYPVGSPTMPQRNWIASAVLAAAVVCTPATAGMIDAIEFYNQSLDPRPPVRPAARRSTRRAAVDQRNAATQTTNTPARPAHREHRPPIPGPRKMLALSTRSGDRVRRRQLHGRAGQLRRQRRLGRPEQGPDDGDANGQRAYGPDNRSARVATSTAIAAVSTARDQVADRHHACGAGSGPRPRTVGRRNRGGYDPDEHD